MANTREEIEKNVASIIADVLFLDSTPTNTDHLNEDLLIEDDEIYEVCDLLESDYDILFSEDDVDKMLSHGFTVADLVEMVVGKQA